jgi:hypothetical protein
MLVPLINQIGFMQQQMFDQFQQAMTMMVQMFGTMHREQMEMIRAELDGLHDLTEEFHALKKELANRTQAEDTTVLSTPANGLKGVDKTITTEPIVSAKTTADGSSGLKTMQTDTRSAIQAPSLASIIPDQPSLPIAGASSPRPASKPAAVQPAEKLPESGLRSHAKIIGASEAVDSERDSIVWLHQRIMTLQHERETRWQKILKLLPGVS